MQCGVEIKIVNLKIKETKGCKSWCILDKILLIDEKSIYCDKDVKYNVVWEL